MDPINPCNFGFAESQVTPVIGKVQQLLSVELIPVVKTPFISCHDRTTQQHCGDDEVQLAMEDEVVFVVFVDFVAFVDFVVF